MARVDRSRSGNVGAEQAYCPACDLRQVRRPDWLCMRCGMPVETEAWRTAVRAPSAEPEGAPGFPLGSVVAGALLALASVLLALGFGLRAVTERRWPPVAAAVLLLVLGVELLLRVAAARWVAGALAALALLVGAEDALRARLPELVGDPLPPALRGALHGALGALDPARLATAAGALAGILLLVVGRPGRWRIAAGALLAAALPAAEIVRWALP